LKVEKCPGGCDRPRSNHADELRTETRGDVLDAGARTLVTTLPDGTVQTTVVGIDGSRSVVQPDGTAQSLLQGPDEPDQRFGMQAPVGENGVVMMEGSLGVGRRA
jgi:hypothetical protein